MFRNLAVSRLIALAAVGVFALAARAQEASPSQASAQPVTTQDIHISVEELKVLIKPLTAQELEVEAEAWMKLVRAKAKEIAAAQVAVRRTNKALDAAAQADTQGAAQAVEEAARVVESATTQAAAEQAAAGADRAAADSDSPPPPAADADAAADPEAAKEAAGSAKGQFLERLTELRSQQTALMDRLNTVLVSWEAKGGDVESYRQYIAAISGLDVDVRDASAAWATISGWVMSEEGGRRWMWNVGKFVAVVMLTWLIARVIGGLFRKLTSGSGKRMSMLAQDAIAKTVKSALWIIGLVLALTMLEVNITPLLAAIGAAGLVIGLALQGTLSNIASGVMILVNRPFDLGDVVTAGGVTGKVSEMTLVATVFRSFDNQTIIVPNNEIWGQVITNITANDTRRVDMTFSVGYSDDLDKAERIIREVVESHELVLSDPEPFIRVNELAESSVNIACRPWARTSDYYTVLCDVVRRVKDRFDAEGISIPFPQRDINVRNFAAREAGEAMQLVPPHAG